MARKTFVKTQRLVPVATLSECRGVAKGHLLFSWGRTVLASLGLPIGARGFVGDERFVSAWCVLCSRTTGEKKLTPTHPHKTQQLRTHFTNKSSATMGKEKVHMNLVVIGHVDA